MIQRPKNGTTLLIGGNLICNTMHARGLLSGISVQAVLVGNSPFSLACTEPRQGEYALDARGVDLGNGLERFLQENPAEFLVLDLHYVCQPLIGCGESYFTKFPDSVPEDCGEDARFISIRELTKEQKRLLIESYADTLLKYFPAQNIALIKTVKSEFYAVKGRVRAQENAQLNQFVGECEEWFKARTGCMSIETLKFYFMEKKTGGTQYEDEAYADLADNVRRFVRRQHVRQRPIFRYSLDRYCRYYDNLYKRAFGAFLRTSNAVENLVYSSEPWFVQENYELLRSAEKLLRPGCREVAEGLDMSLPNAQVVKEIFLAMDAAGRKDYVNPDVHYELLFENRITVRTMWQDVRKYAADHWEGTFPEQITEVNYGYYFALMQLQLTENRTVCSRAARIIQRLQADETVELTPHVIDLWGSCVSRLPFQYDSVAHDCKMVFRGNMFQALPVFLEPCESAYDRSLFAPPITADNKVVQYQLDGEVCARLNETGSDWVVIDLYTLTALSVFRYRGKLYCDNQNFCSRKLGASKVDLHKAFTVEEIFAELDKFADYIRSRYGSRVILIKHKRMEHYLDHNGKVNRFPKKEHTDSVERNPFNDLYTNYFAKRCGCYYIDIIDQFLSDEMNLLYLNSVHYENEFYQEVRRLMRYIIAEEPNQRHFTTYDSHTRVKRIAKLTAVNPGSNVVKGLFRGGWLDSALLKLPSQVVSANAEVFARLYDEAYPDLKTALEKFSWEGWEKAREALSGKS